MEMISIKRDKGEKEEIVATVENQISVNLQTPRRILHFSDGVLEEFDDEEEVKPPPEVQIDESKLPWGPWFVHKAYKTGNSVLAGCDYVGEGLASFLGITTPKYQSEIEEFKRIQKESDDYEKDKEELKSWQEKVCLNNNEVVTKELTSQNGIKDKF